MTKSTNTDRFGYTGQMWLVELGLFHCKARMYSPRLGRFLQTDPVGYQDQIYNCSKSRARYYDAQLGRFLQTDPIGYEDQMNLYAYTGNDSVNLRDPSGKNSCLSGGADCIAKQQNSYIPSYDSTPVNYGTKISSGKQAEEEDRKRVRSSGQVVVAGRVSANYESSTYIRGREYDSVSIDASGHYYLKELKYRVTDNKNGGLKSIKQLEWMSAAYQAALIANTARQAHFDLNASTITLTGKGIAGGEVTLESGQYSISWILVNQNGKGIEADVSDAAAISEIINKSTGHL